MLKLRVRWRWVVIVSAALIAVLLAFYRYQYVLVGSTTYRIDALTGYFCRYPCETPPPQTYPTQEPPPAPTPDVREAYKATLPLKEQLDWDRAARFQKLQASTPMSESNFGQQMEVTSFRLNHDIRQVLEAHDGELYVVSETCVFVGPGGCSRFHLGLLDGDHFTEIWLPHERSDWQDMELLATSTPKVAVVKASPWGELNQPHQYQVTTHDIIQTAATKDKTYAAPIDRHLRSGDACRIERSPGTAAFASAVDARGRVRPLVSKSAILRVVQGLVKLSDLRSAYCTHFQDVDMLVVGDGYDEVTFVVKPGNLWLAAPAAPFAITLHHLIVFTNALDASGAPSGDTFDYINVTRKHFP